MTLITPYRFPHHEYRFFARFRQTHCHEFHFYRKTKKEQAPSAVPAPFFLEVPYFLAARAATWAFNSSSSDLISLFSACILSFFSFKSLIWFAISTLE